MKNLIYLELKKALTNVRFKIIFAVSQILSIWSLVAVYQQYQSDMEYILYWKDKFPVQQIYTVCHAWMLNEQISIGRTVFFLGLPLLAAFPFAASFYQEEKKKQLSHVLIRTKKMDYFVAKYIAVFLAGMLIISGTLIINFITTAMVFPWEKPLPFEPYFSVFSNDMWSDIFYTTPLIYIFGYIFIEGLYGGIFSGAVFVLSLYIKKQFSIFGIVMFVYLAIDVIRGRLNLWFPQSPIAYEFSPYGFLRISGFQRNAYLIFGIAIVLFCIQCIALIRRGRKYEIY